VLPPLYRFLASIITLPHRRFYTPATDYTTVPSEPGLHPIPSVINLPSLAEMESDEEVPLSTGRAMKRNVGILLGHADVKNRKAPGIGNLGLPTGDGTIAGNDKGSGRLAQEQVNPDNNDGSGSGGETVKRYDAYGELAPS
jgi:hypothetical protein